MENKDENTNDDNAQGKGTVNNPEENKGDTSDLNKLKSSNDEFEKELVRGRELKAERQKLEAENLLGGDNGGNVKPEVKEVSDEDYAKQVMSGEIGDEKG